MLALVAEYIGLSAFDTTPDANLGLTLGMPALAATSAPWRLPVLMSNRVSIGSSVRCGSRVRALLILVLDAVALRWWSKGPCRGLNAR